MNATFDRLLQKLETDHESGASSLALATLSDLHCYLHGIDAIETNKLRDMAERLAQARPSMAPLRNALRRWLDKLPPDIESDFKSTYLQRLADIRGELQQVGEQVGEHAASLIAPGSTLLTHSRSSQVMTLFSLLLRRKIPFNVIVTMSAPGNEGILVARQLNAWRVATTLITDAELGLFMPQADINIIGCDAWLADDHVVNKSGTLLQALAARHYGKPLWVLADSFKDSPETRGTVKLEEMPAAELHCPQGEFITARNLYFEPLPARLISGRIDEHGLHPRPI